MDKDRGGKMDHNHRINNQNNSAKLKHCTPPLCYHLDHDIHEQLIQNENGIISLKIDKTDPTFHPYWD